MNAMLNSKAPTKLEKVQQILHEVQEKLEWVDDLIPEATDMDEFDMYINWHTKLKAQQDILLEVLQVLNEN